MMRSIVCAIAVALTLALAPAPATAQWNPSAGDWGKTASTDVRVMTFNVLDGFRTGVDMDSTSNQWHALVRIVALLKPDVLLLQETGDQGCFNCVDSTAELQDVAADFLRGTSGNSVYVQAYAPGYDLPHVFASAETDGFNRNVILSRFPFTDLNGDTRSAYSDIPTVSPFAAWAPGGDGGIRGFQFAEIDLPNGTYAGNLVVGGAHLKAGGQSGDFSQRLTAAQNVSWFIEQFYNGAGTGSPDPSGTISDSPPATTILGPSTPIVIGGDWNEDEGSNGRRGPEAWLSEGEFAEPTLDGTDRDRTDMDSSFLTAFDLTGDPDTRGSSTLDYLAWQDSIATLRRAIIFNSQNISGLGYPTPSPEWDGIGFVSVISATASDHLPVFVDLILPLGVPSGACCFGTTCQILTATECSNQGGVYQGDDTSCSPNPCQPTGACCVLGVCTVETESDCLSMGGTYQGDATDCAVNPCPPAGACCVLGACSIETESDCLAMGGTYQGDDTTCSPNPCPPVGACCIAGNCSLATEADCLAAGGLYLGDGTTCAGDPCPNTGACCFPCDPSPTSPCPDASGANGPACLDLTSTDCNAAGGIFRGDATTCASGTCLCIGDLNADGVTDVFDFGNLAANFGAGNPGCATRAQGDLDCNGVVDIFDFGIFANDFGCP